MLEYSQSVGVFEFVYKTLELYVSGQCVCVIAGMSTVQTEGVWWVEG